MTAHQTAAAPSPSMPNLSGPSGEAFASAGAYRAELDHKGTVMVPAEVIFSAAEIDQLDALQGLISEELVTLGDAGEPNDLYVRRMMVDKPGQMPQVVNSPVADQILAILGTPERHAFFAALLGREKFIRRCQVNRMVENSFIGLHLDTDSNPDYDVAVVIQLGRAFGGGEFAVYPSEGISNVFHPTFGTVTISRCELPHEVMKVTKGERTSMVFFLSDNRMENAKA